MQGEAEIAAATQMLRQMGVHSIPTFIVDGRTIVNGKTCTPVFPSLCDSYSNLHQQNPTPPMLHVLRLIDGCRRVCSVGDMVTSPWPQEKSRIAEPCLQNMAPIAEPCYIFQGAAREDEFVQLFRKLEASGDVRGGSIFCQALGVPDEVVEHGTQIQV